MRTTAEEAVNYQNLLHNANTRINGLMTEITNLRTDFLRREQLITNAWRDERRARQLGDADIIDLRRLVCRNIREKCWWRTRYTACVQQTQNLKTYYQNHKADADGVEFWV